MEAVYRDYAPKGVQFHFVYKSLAHPEKDGYVNPVTIEERLLHIREAKRVFEGHTMPWLSDNIENDLKHKLGGLNNPEFIFDPAGKIVRLRDWSSPTELRRDLETLVGEVAKPTSVRDLNLQTNGMVSPTAAKGIVPRINRTGPMRPIKAAANIESKSPFYAKVRVEADSDLIRNGSGQLYLGFHLDPLLGVSWNNLAKPVEYQLAAADGISLSPAAGKGPKVEVESDSDPREFLVDVKGWKKGEPLSLQVRYFACNKVEGWCKPVTQTYEIRLEEDKDAGTVRTRGGGRGGRRGGPGGGGIRRPGGF